MYSALTAVVLSLGAVLALVAIFRAEETHGARVFRFIRERLDYQILKVTHTTLRLIRNVSRDVLRQTVRYFFHTFLKSTLALLTRFEHSIKNMMRSNSLVAKRSERDRVSRNKLEEIALHKMEVALTEEEKRRHREKSLRG